jgi:hypothetical protein
MLKWMETFEQMGDYSLNTRPLAALARVSLAPPLFFSSLSPWSVKEVPRPGTEAASRIERFLPLLP